MLTDSPPPRARLFLLDGSAPSGRLDIYSNCLVIGAVGSEADLQIRDPRVREYHLACRLLEDGNWYLRNISGDLSSTAFRIGGGVFQGPQRILIDESLDFSLAGLKLRLEIVRPLPSPPLPPPPPLPSSAEIEVQATNPVSPSGLPVYPASEGRPDSSSAYAQSSRPLNFAASLLHDFNPAFNSSATSDTSTIATSPTIAPPTNGTISSSSRPSVFSSSSAASRPLPPDPVDIVSPTAPSRRRRGEVQTPSNKPTRKGAAQLTPPSPISAKSQNPTFHQTVASRPKSSPARPLFAEDTRPGASPSSVGAIVTPLGPSPDDEPFDTPPSSPTESQLVTPDAPTPSSATASSAPHPRHRKRTTPTPPWQVRRADGVSDSDSSEPSSPRKHVRRV